MKIDFSERQPDPQIKQAEFKSKCAHCGEWIEEDDWIILDEDGNWVHDEHK